MTENTLSIINNDIERYQHHHFNFEDIILSFELQRQSFIDHFIKIDNVLELTDKNGNNLLHLVKDPIILEKLLQTATYDQVNKENSKGQIPILNKNLDCFKLFINHKHQDFNKKLINFTHSGTYISYYDSSKYYKYIVQSNSSYNLLQDVYFSSLKHLPNFNETILKYENFNSKGSELEILLDYDGKQEINVIKTFANDGYDPSTEIYFTDQIPIAMIKTFLLEHCNITNFSNFYSLVNLSNQDKRKFYKIHRTSINKKKINKEYSKIEQTNYLSLYVFTKSDQEILDYYIDHEKFKDFSITEKIIFISNLTSGCISKIFDKLLVQENSRENKLLLIDFYIKKILIENKVNLLKKFLGKYPILKNHIIYLIKETPLQFLIKFDNQRFIEFLDENAILKYEEELTYKNKFFDMPTKRCSLSLFIGSFLCYNRNEIYDKKLDSFCNFLLLDKIIDRIDFNKKWTMIGSTFKGYAKYGSNVDSMIFYASIIELIFDRFIQSKFYYDKNKKFRRLFYILYEKGILNLTSKTNCFGTLEIANVNNMNDVERKQSFYELLVSIETKRDEKFVVGILKHFFKHSSVNKSVYEA